ncbi:hypothetical protein BGZ80_005566, partial [Entomortierella chlamydospora]
PAKSSQNPNSPHLEILDMERSNYPIAMNVGDSGLDFRLSCQAVHPIDASKICGYMQQSLQSLVDALDDAPNKKVRDLEVMPIVEREMLLQSWNTTESYPSDQSIHKTFEDQVKQSPDATAIVCEGQQMSYRELNARANSLAHRLIDLGVKPDSLVAICVDRSLAMIIGLLAILKAGGAYVPLDPMFASGRLQDILTDAAPSILLADESGISALGNSISKSIVVIDPNESFETSIVDPQVSGLTSHHLAYVIYTSGSTGKPKGVMVEHAQVTRLFDSTAAWYKFSETDIWIMTHTFSFDVSVWEIWGALRHGSKLVIPSYRTTQSPDDLYRMICDHGVTVLNMTPSAFRPLIRSQAQLDLQDKLRYVILAGEALEPAILHLWYSTRSSDYTQIINMYGTTETTVHATFRIMRPEDHKLAISPIGVRIPDLTFYVLDDRGNPVPLGAIGELCIGGAGVTRGYLNKPDLTSERFPLDPFNKTEGTRMYKTGDLVRYLPDGNLIYLGRNDYQVKIRGYRVELGETEACLLEHPAVREAVVLELDEGSNKRLVAYVVVDPVERLAHTLWTHVSAKLPEYMIPAAFVRMDVFPLTTNGKLDRRALPEPSSDAFASQGYEAPQGEIEKTLAAIWSDVLKVDQIGRHDNFFMLGGHSLLAVQMIERLHRVELNLSIRDLFETPTLSALSQSLNKHHIDAMAPTNRITPDVTVITPDLLPLIDLSQDDINTIVKQVDRGVANIQDIYALSPLQDGILFHHIIATKGDPYLLTNCLVIDNRDILDRFIETIQKVVDRHDILRTAIIWEHLSSPAQVVIRQATLTVTEMVLDLANGPASKQLLELFNPREYRIELSQAPLTRFAVAQDIDGRWVVVQMMHHIIGDHSTMKQMMIEIQAFLEGQDEVLPSPQPFRNLIAQARSGPSVEDHKKFFSEMLVDIDTPALPYGVSDVHSNGIDITESNCMLPQILSSRLRGHAKRMGVSLASLCHLAWAQVISRTSGQERVVFGTVLFGRMQSGSGSDTAMGLFINTLPFRIDLDDGGVQDRVLQTHGNLARLLDHEHASLALAQRCSSIPAGAPLFSAMLNYRHNNTPSSENQSLSGIKILEGIERTNYPFVMSIDDGGDTLGLNAQVIQPFDPSRICGYMQQSLQSLADALDYSPEMPVQNLETLTPDEQELLLHTWNTSGMPHPDHLCIHQYFESQVTQSPDAIAVVFEDQQMSYDELNAHANTLAHHLISLGVKPDTLVAICVE